MVIMIMIMIIIHFFSNPQGMFVTLVTGYIISILALCMEIASLKLPQKTSHASSSLSS